MNASISRAHCRRLTESVEGWRERIGLTPAQAARKLGTTTELMRLIQRGEIDPRELAPSTALTFIIETGLDAAALGFEDPAPVAAGVFPGRAATVTDGGAVCPNSGAPTHQVRAHYEVPDRIVIGVGATAITLTHDELSALLARIDVAVAAAAAARDLAGAA